MRFDVNLRSIQKELDAIWTYFAYNPESVKKLVYDRAKNGYVLVRMDKTVLMNSETLTVCKILLESRSLVKEEKGKAHRLFGEELRI